MLLTKADYVCNHNQQRKNRKDKILFILSSAQQHRLYGRGRDEKRERESARNSHVVPCACLCYCVDYAMSQHAIGKVGRSQSQTSNDSHA